MKYSAVARAKSVADRSFGARHRPREGRRGRRPLWVVLAIASLWLLGCTGPDRVESLNEPQCFSQCANRFSVCSGELHPGDYTACSSKRKDCEQSCLGDKAVRQAEQKEGEPVGPTPEEVERFQNQDEQDEPEDRAGSKEAGPSGDADKDAGGEGKKDGSKKESSEEEEAEEPPTKSAAEEAGPLRF